MQIDQKEGLPNILVVEDDDNQRRAIVRLLSKLGAEIHEANSGQKALSLLIRKKFMLVLLDINMPRMDGIETAQIMRSNKHTEHIPIIYITAYNQDEKSIEEAYKLGAIDYLFKPLKQEILLSKVEMILRFYKVEKERENEKEREREREREKEEVLRNAALLAKKNEGLQQFAYIASHDLQSPLKTVINYVNLLEEECKNEIGQSGEKYLNVITKATSRMKTLIKDLLDYSRLGQDREKDMIDCNKILEHVQEDLSSKIQETKTILEIDDLPQLQAFKTEISLLFQNLISNAIKFRKKGVAPHIRIHAEETEGGWMFSIEDNGIGIKKEYQEKVFLIFQRLHTQKMYEGTGIGLAHCSKIVELHGGEIWVESIEGKGSVFYFTIKSQQIHEAKNKTKMYSLD